MELSNIGYLILAASEPIVILLAFLRTTLCIYRSYQSKHSKFTLFSVLIAILLLLIIAIIVIVWFGYGVSHSGKSETTDLIVLTGTLLLAYISSVLAWCASTNMDKLSVKNHA